MQCNYNSFIQIINFHGFFSNAPRCRKTGTCRILVPLRYSCIPLKANVRDEQVCSAKTSGTMLMVYINNKKLYLTTSPLDTPT